jgi:imidazolonepropionase-like amidohydrolase
MLPRVREMARNAKQAGVRIVAATDTGYGPESTTRLGHELEEFVGIGMTPLEALQSATLTTAELFGIQDRTGRIASGMEADLIVLERNPLEDVRVLQDVLMVISNGAIVAQKGDWPARRTT